MIQQKDSVEKVLLKYIKLKIKFKQIGKISVKLLNVICKLYRSN